MENEPINTIIESIEETVVLEPEQTVQEIENN